MFMMMSKIVQNWFVDYRGKQGRAMAGRVVVLEVTCGEVSEEAFVANEVEVDVLGLGTGPTGVTRVCYGTMMATLDVDGVLVGPVPARLVNWSMVMSYCGDFQGDKEWDSLYHSFHDYCTRKILRECF